MSHQAPLPAPTGAPRDTTPPAAARRRRPRLVLAIVGGGAAFVLLLGAVVWGAGSLGQRVGGEIRHAAGSGHRTTPSPARSHGAGPASPGSGSTENTGPRAGARHATAPLGCAEECITMASAVAGIALAPRDVAAIGAPEKQVDDFDIGPSDPQSDWEDTLSEWRDSDPTGDPCMFTYAYVPLWESETTSPRDDHSATRYLAEYADEDDDSLTGVTIAARAFTSSPQAALYARDLEDAIALCRHYAIDGWDAQVDAIDTWPDLPADVTAVGWTEHESEGGVYDGVDLQRGNLVLRLTIDMPADQGAAAVQRLVSAVADRLERLPADGSSPPNA